MYPGDRHPMRASARCHLYRSPVFHTSPFIHAVIIRSCKVAQLCDADSLGVHTWVPEGGGTHIGLASGHKRRAMCELATRRRGARWRHAPRVGKWAQADGDVRTSDARAWGT